MRHRSEHGLRATGISWAITLLFLGCSTPGIHQIQIDLDNIQQQLWKIQKENAALTEEVARVREAGVAPSGSVDTDAASLTLRFQELERDLERLQSHLDDTDQRLTAVVQDLRMTRDALQALVVTLPAGRPQGAETPESGMAGIGDPRDPAMIVPPRREATPIALENLYNQGEVDFRKGNYSLALQELTEFVERYPDSPLADDAHYLMGEVHFTQHQYSEAIDVFDRLVNTYPGGDKTGPAYLKKGLALLEMNRTADAVVQLQHVINAYPESDEANVARERLRGLGLQER